MVVTWAGCGASAERADGVRVAVAAAPESLDPRFATSATAMRLSQVAAPPLCVVGDDGRPEMVLARSLTRIDNLTVEAKLDGTRRFPEGDRVRADDVVFSYASVLDEATRSPQRVRLRDLDRVVAVDDDTVRFVLRQPSAPFIVDVVCATGILSRAACAGKARCERGVIGAGAVVDDAGVDRVRFRHATADGHDLDVRVMRDGRARLLAVAAGDIDVVAGDVAPWDVAQLPPAVRALSTPALGFSYLGINTRRCGDGCRRAIADLVDVDALIAGRLRGRAQRASGLLPPGHWAKDQTLAPWPHSAAGVDAARRWFREHKEKAREKAREKTGTKTGETAGEAAEPAVGMLRLLTTPDRVRRSVALSVRDALGTAGVDVEIVVRDWSVLYEDLKAGRFDLVLAKWTPVAEPDLLTTVFHSKSIPTADTPGGNRGAFRDPDVDAWLDAARIAGDDATRAALYAQVERRVQERMALVPLWFDDDLWLVGPRVHGLVLRRTGSFLPLTAVTLSTTPPTTPEAP